MKRNILQPSSTHTGHKEITINQKTRPETISISRNYRSRAYEVRLGWRRWSYQTVEDAIAAARLVAGKLASPEIVILDDEGYAAEQIPLTKSNP